MSLAPSATGVTQLASNLPDGPHTATLRATGGTVRLGSFLVQRRAPFGWIVPLLTLGVILIGAGAIGTIVAALFGACDDALRRTRRRRATAMQQRVAAR